MGRPRGAAGTFQGTAGRLGRSLVRAGEDAAPRGRVVRMQLRVTLDTLITLAIVAFAVVTSTAYQVMRLWVRRTNRP